MLHIFKFLKDIGAMFYATLSFDFSKTYEKFRLRTLEYHRPNFHFEIGFF